MKGTQGNIVREIQNRERKKDVLIDRLDGYYVDRKAEIYIYRWIDGRMEIYSRDEYYTSFNDRVNDTMSSTVIIFFKIFSFSSGVASAA